MKKRGLLTLPVLLVAIVALALGSVGTATAGGLSKSAVKKIAAKVVAKKAPGLSVAHASTADSATTATNATTAANANALNGLAANSLVRATSAAAALSLDNFNASTFTTVVTKTVNAPVAGLIYVEGDIDWARDFDNGAGVPGAILARTLTDTVGGPTSDGVDNTTATTGVGSTTPVSNVFPVAAGAHTVSLQLAEDGAGNSFIYSAHFNTIFVPFGNAGGQGQLGSAPSTTTTHQQP